jgi:hypothetical protein
MNLLADEGADRPTVDRLRQDGHEVAYIAEMSPVAFKRKAALGVACVAT